MALELAFEMGRPRTLAEKARVERELKRKYPQMSTKKWKDSVAKARGKKAAKKKPKVKSVAKAAKERRSAERSALRSALSADEIARLR